MLRLKHLGLANERTFVHITRMKTSMTPGERQQHILSAAITCFIGKGFHATSMRDIARQAGVSLGNLYNHFSGKQQLISEVAALEQKELAPVVTALDALAAPDITALSDILSQLFALCRQPDWAILTAECLAEIARTPGLVPVFEANRLHLLNTLSSAVARGIESRHFSTSLPPSVVAQILIDGIEAEALRAALSPSYASGCPILAKETLTVLLGASTDE
nr:TetR/AcrR family transcriptional regulator [uncultured Enterobacter sp.]